tara:strand:- start:1247 stop:1627 length:381 start_codon:yes stop_codon:yes gene_type:complete
MDLDKKKIRKGVVIDEPELDEVSLQKLLKKQLMKKQNVANMEEDDAEDEEDYDPEEDFDEDEEMEEMDLSTILENFFIDESSNKNITEVLSDTRKTLHKQNQILCKLLQLLTNKFSNETAPIELEE